jgi:flagellar assembly factor FliW
MTETLIDAIAVEFASALPGLAPHTAFTLEPIADADGLYALRAAEADLRLFVLDARSAVLDYAPRIPAAALVEIGATEESDIRVLIVANPSEEGVHLNLKAPILVHGGTGRALQVILDDQDYPVRALLSA